MVGKERQSGIIGGEEVGGKPPEDKTYKIVESAKSAVTNGEHLILNVFDLKENILGHDQLTHGEQMEAISILKAFAQRQRPNGKWVIALNGHGLTTRPTFHVHAICPAEGDEVLRVVFNAQEFLSRLRKSVIKSNTPSLLNLVEELENNLK